METAFDALQGAIWTAGWGARWQLRCGERLMGTYRPVWSLSRRLAIGEILGRPWCLQAQRFTPSPVENTYLLWESSSPDGEAVATFVLRGFELRSSGGDHYEFRWAPHSSNWQLVAKDGAEVLTLREPTAIDRTGVVVPQPGRQLHIGDAAQDIPGLEWLVVLAWDFYQDFVVGGAA
jgi:hypothetical protein